MTARWDRLHRRHRLVVMSLLVAATMAGGAYTGVAYTSTRSTIQDQGLNQYVSPAQELADPTDTNAVTEVMPSDPTNGVDYVNGPILDGPVTYPSTPAGVASTTSATLPNFGATAMTTQVGTVNHIEETDPSAVAANELLAAFRLQLPTSYPDPRVIWVLMDPAISLSLSDMQAWGPSVNLGNGATGVLLSGQSGTPNSVTWLDPSAAVRWSILAPPGELADTQLEALAQLVRTCQAQTPPCH